MIVKSKDILVSMIRQTLPTVKEIAVEKSPDVSSGPGVKIILDSSTLEPVSGSMSNATVGWRIAYMPASSGSESDIYVALNTLIEAVFDKAVYRTTDKIPFKVTRADIIRTKEGIFLKMILSTTLKQNTLTYDPMRDVNLSTGG